MTAQPRNDFTAIAPVAAPHPLAALPQHDANALTGGGNQALILLNDQVYNLRITRAGKLILTK
ncbi:MAG: hemin uptake protein HemP [Paracoccus sp. (in: a-proteobacteria)]|uniref:hemin uptake protein HemP n=1 Tax=Paracoccus sp. TaxID=267 RepID=UPI0026DF5251|nr:hemin uptake protein HemP [Paracoccus sp. (in: a-proteobacteria)]MDO5620442.1 hemin uptake protein HemP [Paracoccus sp. (in: a-proteobacteria)]